ncbi:lipopolysaccharide biosynthesis protein [Sphingopyxis terrae]|uniref:Membrane protein involved in the export of O-antigen and teichoic acid n=1 Tax=Sphingopyxis terrae subsp. ummariensis TaxID=429001 RepID=A0A1Y6FSY5_9SPHN|nr:lipopolysaccharide biosynthesis protein [Sphingopyxis terrae]PCF91405.1 hypothetical protein CPA46_08110 [Sphingopyxis terrae subsp. ummariensis]SMQ76591.1 Membrane protein involved in the export of O-antigen and teichoic acid [Sphingopyxis terrae subsp. ummariensis]
MVRLCQHFKRHRLFLQNLSLTVSSSGFQAVCAVAALALNARSLGVHDFGILALIQAYTAMISSLMTFESWQPMIRLGVKSRLRLGLTLGSGTLLDFCAAALATIVAISGILLFGASIGIPAEYRQLAFIYSLSLLAGVAGTPKGYFRLTGRYSVLVGNQIAQGLALLIASAILWAADARLDAYVITFAIIAATYNITLFLRMLWHIRRSEAALANPLRSPVARRYLRRVLAMSTGTSLLSTLWNIRRNLSLFLVGALVGPAATGVFAVGSKLANMVSRISGPLNQVLFPETVKALHGESVDGAEQMIRRLSLFTACGAAAMAIAAYLLRQPIVSLAAGPGYEGATIIFSLLFLAECIGLAGLHLNAILQAIWGTKPLLIISSLALLLFAALAATLAGPMGAVGIATASAAAAAFLYLGMQAATKLALVRQRSGALSRGLRGG